MDSLACSQYIIEASAPSLKASLSMYKYLLLWATDQQVGMFHVRISCVLAALR